MKTIGLEIGLHLTLDKSTIKNDLFIDLTYND